MVINCEGKLREIMGNSPKFGLKNNGDHFLSQIIADHQTKCHQKRNGDDFEGHLLDIFGDHFFLFEFRV